MPEPPRPSVEVAVANLVAEATHGKPAGVGAKALPWTWKMGSERKMCGSKSPNGRFSTEP